MSDLFLLDERSLEFAEDFVPMPEAIQAAHDQAITMGAEAPSPGVCAALTFFARLVKATNVVEIGTGTGTSGLAFFEGMTPDGVLTTIDVEADQQMHAREAFRAHGITSRQVRLIPGNPLEVLNNLRADAYDVVFINANKLEYVEYLDQAERLLRSGGLVILGDALWRNLVADHRDESDETVIIREALESITANEAFTPLMLPLGNGLVVAVRQ